MQRSSKYLAWSALRALSALNARTSIARDGWASIPSFAFGLVPSELPLQHAAAFGASAAVGVARGVHKTTAGKLGLGLTVAAAAGLWQIHEQSKDAGRLVELALVDELGADHRGRMASNPLAPTTTQAPLLPSPKVRAKYVVGPDAGHVAYGEFGRRTTLDVWKRPDLPADAKAPVLIQVHGGAWMTGDKEGQAYPLMAHMVERGWVVVSITYRLSPRASWPDHIVDVKRAIAWVKDHIANHGGDPDWVAITGGSAGGHLCSLAALTPNDPQFQPGFEDADTSVRAAVPFYGVYDWTNRDGTGRADVESFLEERVLKVSRADAPDVWEQASSMTHVGADAIPFMILHGTNDSLVPVEQARAMVDMMRKVSQEPVVYVEFPGAQHAFDAFGSNRTIASIEGIERFLNVVRAQSSRA